MYIHDFWDVCIYHYLPLFWNSITAKLRLNVWCCQKQLNGSDWLLARETEHFNSQGHAKGMCCSGDVNAWCRGNSGNSQRQKGDSLRTELPWLVCSLSKRS